MSLSQLARSIAESPTLRLNEEARLLRERGEAVIHLGIGEPKNKTPITAILSAAAKLSGGDVKYTPTDGMPSLKKAIIRYTEENYDRLVAPENVIVSAGAKQALFNAAVHAPQSAGRGHHPGAVLGELPRDGPDGRRGAGRRHAGGRHLPAAPGGHRAGGQRRTPRPIIVNSPNNPSGVVFPEDFIAELVEFCERKGIYLIMRRHLSQARLRRHSGRRRPTASPRRTSSRAGSSSSTASRSCTA